MSAQSQPGLFEETRVGHWLKDMCDVYIGRGSKWGNPYVQPGGAARSQYRLIEVADPLGAYETHVIKTRLVFDLDELRGKVLGCFCVRLDAKVVRERCHGHVLVRLVRERFPC